MMHKLKNMDSWATKMQIMNNKKTTTNKQAKCGMLCNSVYFFK